MACMLYARYNGKDERLGTFKDRKAAQKYGEFYLDRLRATEGHYAVLIYVETGKGRAKK